MIFERLVRQAIKLVVVALLIAIALPELGPAFDALSAWIDHALMSVTVPATLFDFVFLFIVVAFALGLLVRLRAARTEPQRRMRPAPRRWADQVSLHDVRGQQDADPAMPIGGEEER